jgi:PAS domain S-box-containing protein
MKDEEQLLAHCNSGFVVALISLILTMAFLIPPQPAISYGGKDTATSPVLSGLAITLTPEERNWLDRHAVLKVGGPRAFPPFHFFDGDGNPRGIAFDYLRLIMAQLGVDIEVQKDLPWPEVMRKAREGEIDLISCVARTPERESYLLFSNPYLSFPLVIISRKDAPFIGGLNDLKGMRVAFVEGNSVFEWIERDSIEVAPYFVGSPLKALKAVSSGSAQAHIENLAAAGYLIEKYGLANLKVAAPTSYDNYELHFAVRSDWPELISIINKALAALTPEQHAAIRNDWLSVRYEYGISLTDVLKWILVIVVPIFLVLILIFIWNRRLRQEIAERRRAEEGLRASEEKCRSLFENAPIGIFRTTSRGGVLSVNYAMARLLGLNSPQEALDRYTDLGAQLYADAGRRAQFQRLLRQEGSVENFEYEALTADGRKIWLSMNARIVEFGEDDSFVIEGFTSDITERKRSEADRTLLATAVDQAEENILVTDDHRTILYINPAFERSSGYRSEELKGKKLRALRSDKHDEAFYRNMKETLDRGEVWMGVIINKGKDGKDFEIEGAISPVRDASGSVTHLVAAGRNMSRLRKLERELYQAQKMESVGRLAGGVAHDFNNMLGVILGHAELALVEIDSANPVYNSLHEILNAANRSANLIRQLLAFARKQTISPRVINLNETVENMLKMVRRLIGEDIELVWSPGADLWPVKVDPAQIDQIVANLSINARDAIAGVGRVAIETRNVTLDEAYCLEHPGALPGEYVQLAVNDDGCGMEKEVQDKLFEPFFTTKEVGKGTGLGLATVYGIVKQHNGLIYVRSEPGRGSTFRICLPRVYMHTAEERPLPQEKKNLEGTETVLLVEDEKPILELGKKILERRGYRVLAVQDPVEALELVKSVPGQIDLLITDVIMPRMNGKELAEKLSTFNVGCRYLFMSGYTRDVIAPHGVIDDGLHFLQKPFSAKNLAEKVREILDG